MTETHALEPSGPMAGIRSLELAALSGLPALRTETYKGWVLNFSQGYSRRANSIVPLDAPPVDAGAGDTLVTRIAHCEAAYARAGLPCRFKLTPASQPADLDAVLAERGYQLDAETLVQTLDLAAWPAVDAPPAVALELRDHPDASWLATWEALSARGAQVAVQAALLGAIRAPSLYVRVGVADQPVACARTTIAHGVVGLFDLLVAPGHRRRGLGTALTKARLAWARRRGATGAFLQALEGNAPERALAARLGFVEAYRYWYRQQP